MTATNRTPIYERHDEAEQGARYAAGDVIVSKYQLTTRVGEGGMGAVWIARNLTLHVDVAIKLIRRDLAKNSSVAERLLREARAAARLGHPSIVRVHDFGVTERADPFIVMELLDGESLAAVIDHKGFIAPVNAVQLLLPILSALSAAHRKGIVHRDLKPENIIIVADEAGTVVPKLVDFGIAKLKAEQVIVDDEPSTPSISAHGRRLTQLGAVMGSPEYMSPEQAEGADVDERCDVWSLSVVLYECLTGRRPFVGDKYDDLLLAILIDDPLPTMAHGAGDQALWAIIERGLQKDRNNRWRSAQDMGRALAEWLLEQNVELDIGGTSLRRQWLGESVTSLGDTGRHHVIGEGSAARALDDSQRIGALVRDRPSAPGAPMNQRLVALLIVACVAVAGVAIAAIWATTRSGETVQRVGEPTPVPAAVVDAPPEPVDRDELPAAAVVPTAVPTESVATATATAAPPPPAGGAVKTPVKGSWEDDPGF